jgi:DNA-binding XRE family transcriptional regulator
MEDKRQTIPNLRAWRLYRLLKQGELAKAAGLGEQTIFRLERPGERANELTIHKIARALGVTVQQLLQEQPPEKVCAA